MLLHGVNAGPGDLRVIEEALDVTVRNLYREPPGLSSVSDSETSIESRTD